ncbi:MAG: ABC transporter substrate-binding protein [Clostridia bacterium]|nr:ABC transporter substrate-binding protein [Clostridia bacterium]
MKKMFLRIASFIMAGVICTGLAGCGGNSETSGGETEVPTLTWMIPGDKQEDIQSVLAEVNKITEAKIGAKLDIQFIDTGAFTERMTMNMAGGNEFDLCFTGYVNPYQQSVKRGGLLELDSYIEGSSLKDALPQYAFDAGKIGDSIYAIPNLQIMTECTGLGIRKDLAEKYNLDVSTIKSLEDIEPFLEQVKQNETGVYPFRTGKYGGGEKNDGVFRETLTSGTSAWIDENGEIQVVPVTELESFEYSPSLLRSWFEKGYIRSDVASVVDDTEDGNAGKFAVWRCAYKPGVEAEFNSTNSYEAIIIPISEPKMSNGSGVAAMTAIGRKSKNPDLAFKMIELVNTDVELYNLLCFGIEGKHYNLDETGKVVYIDGSGYAPKASWKFGNQFNALLLPGQSDDVWEVTKQFNEGAKKSSFLGFVFDVEPVRTEVAQIATVQGKYKSLSTGAEPLENYIDDYKADLKTAGVEKVCAELKSQLDAWYASK